MKKIIILILVLLLTTGCYDYKEINKIDLITAIGIDYKDEEYIVTLEVLNDKVEKDSAKITSYTKTGVNKNLAEALEDAAGKLANEANYSHVRLMILSKSILEYKFESIIDFFLRNINFRENFLLISALDDNPEDILNNTSNEHPIASATISEMLESDDYSLNSSIKKPFEKIVKELLTFGIDTCFSNIRIQDKEFVLDGAVAFNGYILAGKLNNKDVSIYNIFNKNIFHPIISKDYGGKTFSIALNSGDVKINILKDKLIIDGNLTGQVINNEPLFKIRSLEDLHKINNDFQDIINNDLEEFITKLKKYNSDILGIDQKKYQDTKEKHNNLWLYLDATANINFELNKKGIIFEVENEE